MSLFSEMDWIVLLAIGGLVLLGNGGTSALRMLGRLYGRAVRMKRELLSEVARAADLPPPIEGQPTSVRAMLLGVDPTPESNVPSVAAAMAVPLAGFSSRSVATAARADGPPPSVWSRTVPFDPSEARWTR